MSDGHGHHHPRPASGVELRARALEALLAERKLVSTDAIDAVVELYENDIGPQNGARVVARAWVDDAYRARLERARELMVCTCDACSSIGRLELKFVLHHCDYVLQSIAGHQRILGPDVTIAHLLLKNHVRDLIGHLAYVLLTESAAAHLQVPLGHAHDVTERYEHCPPIRGHVLTLPPVAD